MKMYDYKMFFSTDSQAAVIGERPQNHPGHIEIHTPDGECRVQIGYSEVSDGISVQLVDSKGRAMGHIMRVNYGGRRNEVFTWTGDTYAKWMKCRDCGAEFPAEYEDEWDYCPECGVSNEFGFRLLDDDNNEEDEDEDEA